MHLKVYNSVSVITLCPVHTQYLYPVLDKLVVCCVNVDMWLVCGFGSLRDSRFEPVGGHSSADGQQPC